MKLAIILPALSLAVAANAQPALVKEHQQVPIGKRLLGTITLVHILLSSLTQSDEAAITRRRSVPPLS